VQIEHDNKNFRPAWFLDKIEIINLGTNEKKTFPCKQWLDKDRGDGAISRELLSVDWKLQQLIWIFLLSLVMSRLGHIDHRMTVMLLNLNSFTH
jgi:hypothetical protein